MAKYLKHVKTITDTLASVSYPLDEEDTVLYILNGLPPVFKHSKLRFECG